MESKPHANKAPAYAALLIVASVLGAGCATSTPPVSAPPAAAAEIPDTPITSPSGVYIVDPRHTSVVWKVQHMGLSLFTARFDASGGELDLDSQSPTKSTVVFTIDAASVSTDLPVGEREKFNAAIARGIGADRTPQIKFVSTHLERTSAQTGRMTGDLTLNGVTKPATFTIILRGAGSNPMFGPGLGIEASATLKRGEWGIDYAKPFTSDEVEIEIDAELHKK